MKDRLEQFISDHREQFDLYEPDERLWTGIESGIGRRKVLGIGWKGLLWRAAAVVLIFGASFLLQEYRHQHRGMLSEREQGKILRKIPELEEAEIYYTGLLDEKLQEVKPLLSQHPELGISLNQDLSELDSIYQELQKDLMDNIANDEVVEAMIQNYVLKIQILEDLLKYMDENSKDQEDEIGKYDI
jgi:hypothetical protein